MEYIVHWRVFVVVNMPQPGEELLGAFTEGLKLQL